MDRKVYEFEFISSQRSDTPNVHPVTMDELLRFIQSKKSSEKGIRKVAAQAIKSAVTKFRLRNGFGKFSEQENVKFATFLKGITKSIGLQMTKYDLQN